MPGIRSQRLKIKELAIEADLARVEAITRFEPIVARVHGSIAAAALVKSIITRTARSAASNPKSPYAAIASSFAVSFLISFLSGRSGRKNIKQK